MTHSPTSRLTSIDQLRGTVIVLMLLDHVRETFYLHAQVADPMVVDQVEPALFVSRLLAHLCAPVFVLLTGLSAWLYASGKPDGRRAASAFLLKRGLFLVVLELLVVNFAWTLQFPPSVVYLQVIWAIGISMIALAGLLWLPRGALAVLALAVIAGHNLLDGIRVQGDGALAVLWKVLHQRDWITVTDGLRLRTSYPVLPWIGVIALGWVIGPWFARGGDALLRQRRLWMAGAGALLAFVLLRAINVYGDSPWQSLATLGTTLMSFFNVTKYPPSLLFLLLTLGIGLLLLRLYEQPRVARALAPLADIGAAPMFFYLLHLYVLKLLYVLAEARWGQTHGGYFAVDHVASLWVITAVLAVALYWPTRAFARFKARRRDLAWLRYL
ncbi:MULTISPECIES: heparan-alpha-glucosaminide N-acetyltransferase domain-containing protein [Stenotrophomonas]|uniref:Heparan-alpha-glucosaminide N-acetyltransferase domain-containing protein n=1 Tax=Stenotrophomonas bentonitica TaxID=1450134 RepID=A0ABU9JJI4_9GAMM|nr:heparan-alpha-glucosaminide N-acetyltransferase domain-containing protein [Stenotrophomonas sp. Ste96]